MSCKRVRSQDIDETEMAKLVSVECCGQTNNWETMFACGVSNYHHHSSCLGLVRKHFSNIVVQVGLSN